MNQIDKIEANMAVSAYKFCCKCLLFALMLSFVLNVILVFKSKNVIIENEAQFENANNTKNEVVGVK